MNGKMDSSLSFKTKSYAQVSKQNTSTSDIIKIKETFPFMGAKEIDQINNIVKGSPSLNRNLRNAKSKVLVDFIRSDPLGVTVVTNKVSLPSDLLIIEKYVKNSENIDSSQVDSPYLPQSKSYLKIIGILYYPHRNLQDQLSSSDVKTVIKQNQIFDNVTLTSKPRVIKASPKSDMAIIWINIWDAQSGVKAKGLINWYFNIG